MIMDLWTRNCLAFVGPPSDPAEIRGPTSGVEAFKRIAAAQAPYLDAINKGGRELSHTLWTKAGARPRGSWVIKDEGEKAKNIITFAEKNNAYAVFGRMPVLFKKRTGLHDNHGRRRPPHAPALYRHGSKSETYIRRQRKRRENACGFSFISGDTEISFGVRHKGIRRKAALLSHRACGKGDAITRYGDLCDKS